MSMLPTGVERKDPVIALLLYFVTCSLYEYFAWLPQRMKAVNTLLGREEYNYTNALLLIIVTCGVMYLYYEYRMAESINELKRARGLEAGPTLPIATLLLDLFQFGFVASFLHQEEINKLAA